MSTKTTIKAKWSTPTTSGFHIYRDAYPVEVPKGAGECAVILELEGVSILEMQTFLGDEGASVTVALPAQLARDLGLI